jgi:hypothetical protein
VIKGHPEDHNSWTLPAFSSTRACYKESTGASLEREHTDAEGKAYGSNKGLLTDQAPTAFLPWSIMLSYTQWNGAHPFQQRRLLELLRWNWELEAFCKEIQITKLRWQDIININVSKYGLLSLLKDGNRMEDEIQNIVHKKNKMCMTAALTALEVSRKLNIVSDRKMMCWLITHWSVACGFSLEFKQNE